MADAYLINPVLNAERARLRATDEQVALAKSGLRPFIGGTADYNYVNQNSERGGLGAGGAARSISARLELPPTASRPPTATRCS